MESFELFLKFYYLVGVRLEHYEEALFSSIFKLLSCSFQAPAFTFEFDFQVPAK